MTPTDELLLGQKRLYEVVPLTSGQSTWIRPCSPRVKFGGTKFVASATLPSTSSANIATASLPARLVSALQGSCSTGVPSNPGREPASPSTNVAGRNVPIGCSTPSRLCQNNQLSPRLSRRALTAASIASSANVTNVCVERR